MNVTDFQEVVWEKSKELYREMPWRQDTQPYYVLVSELMLQQTQVERVIPKFEAFVARFPSIESLATASLGDVLTLWSGLGYNRRAKFLHEAAQFVVQNRDGVFPQSIDALCELPGVGPNTAGAIMAYSFNQPVVFVETNVRTVYFHHFFSDNDAVSDAEVRAAVEATVDTEHPREWYWAIMDYGSFLKRQGVGRNAQSKHYKKQAPLKGSVREIRGQIMKMLTQSDLSEVELKEKVVVDERFDKALDGLVRDGLVARKNGRLHLAG